MHPLNQDSSFVLLARQPFFSPPGSLYEQLLVFWDEMLLQNIIVPYDDGTL